MLKRFQSFEMFHLIERISSTRDIILKALFQEVLKSHNPCFESDNRAGDQTEAVPMSSLCLVVVPGLSARWGGEGCSIYCLRMTCRMGGEEAQQLAVEICKAQRSNKQGGMPWAGRDSALLQLLGHSNKQTRI